MEFEAIDPATGRVVERFQAHGRGEIEQRLALSQRGLAEWRDASFEERAGVLRRMAGILRERKHEWATRMRREMGKPVTQGVAEAEKCATCCDFYADTASSFLANEHVSTDAKKSYVRYDPLGLVLAVMPWNFPFWQVYRAAAPALMGGNGILLKHASNTLGCALDIERIGLEAGLPAGVLQALVVHHDELPAIIADRRVAAVTLTGSEGAGRAIGEAAGRALKKAVLELGGSDAFVVLSDADIEHAASTAAWARAQNAGQSCIAAKRFIVVREVADAFVSSLREKLAALRMGDPEDPETQVGPMARGDLRDTLQKQVDESVRGGASCVLGGRIPEGPGFYYPPTLLTQVRPGQPAWDEETFGPVAAVRVVADEAEALAAANDSRYGLGCSLWTRDTRRGEDLAAFIEAGAVFVNGMVRSDPRLPFGGVKDSGHGRELAWVGLYEFMNVKTVWIGEGGAPPAVSE